MDAFLARFGRLQDTLGDKFLPTLPVALAEHLGPGIDNVDRAEKLGVLPAADEWIAARKLRNRMVHEYVRDAAELAGALNAGHRFVPLLSSFAHRLAQFWRARHWPAMLKPGATSGSRPEFGTQQSLKCAAHVGIGLRLSAGAFQQPTQHGARRLSVVQLGNAQPRNRRWLGYVARGQ